MNRIEMLMTPDPSLPVCSSGKSPRRWIAFHRLNIGCFKAALLIAISTVVCWTAHGDVTVMENGTSRAAIFVSSRVMAPDTGPRLKKGETLSEPEKQRRLLRESVKDLSHYLEKIAGAPVEIVVGSPQGDDKRVPISIGELGEKEFGPVGKSAPFKQGFRYVVSSRGVGLYGESDLASSYAIYELLDRLGCRWYMPSEMGEVIPVSKSIVLKETDFSSAPATVYRGGGVRYSGEDYCRRNRLGGFAVETRHALERYLTPEDRQQHPDWCAEIDGVPHPKRLKWSSEGVAMAIADKINASLDREPRPSVSLSPTDGDNFDNSEAEQRLDAGDFDQASGKVSITNRLLVLCNRIAGQVLEKHPGTKFGMLAYVNYTRPPVRVKPHPGLVPQIAPINFDRAHPITDESAPGNKELRHIVEGWAKVAPQLSYYPYAFFLADTATPYPMIKKWSIDLPIFHKNNCAFWQPETKPNFDSSMYGIYLGNRLAWDPKQNPADIIDELSKGFYGNAAAEMHAYWTFIDDVWVNTPEYTGGPFGHLLRFTPEVMTKARELMNAGLAACKTDMERRRVEMANRSLQQFELFMKLRRDFAAGRFGDIGKESQLYRDTALALGREYMDQYAFGPITQSPKALPYNVICYDWCYTKSYGDAARIEKDFQVLTSPLKFKYNEDRDGKGVELGWNTVGFDDASWKETDSAVETWSTLGLYDYRGVAWYRCSLELPSIPAGKKVFLWLSATDGDAEVFVNGKPIVYKNPKAKEESVTYRTMDMEAEVSADGKPIIHQTPDANAPEVFTGYCDPVSFDITEALTPGGKNQLAIRCKRVKFNELGTGGLLGPVLAYREKDSTASEQTGR